MQVSYFRILGAVETLRTSAELLGTAIPTPKMDLFQARDTGFFSDDLLETARIQ